MDTFRRQYRPLSDMEKADMDEIKSEAQVLLDRIKGDVPDERCRALAITKLEECVMWATKGITG